MVNPITDLYTTPHKSIFDNDSKFIPTGVRSFDNMTNDLPTKKVTVLTGVPKEGKSTFLQRAALNAIDKGYKVLLVDGEHNRDELINQLYSMVVGNMPNAYIKDKVNKLDYIEPKPHIIEKLREWHKSNLMIFNKHMAPFNTLEELFNFVEPVVSAHNIDLVIWDNLMMLVDGTGAEKNENQSRFMKRVCDLAKSQNCHCMVVAHPNKGAKQGEPMGIYDVLGSSDIVNLVDYLVQIMRSYDKDDDADGYARILLNRTRGANIGDIPLKYDPTSRSLYEMCSDGRPMKYEFDIERNAGEQEWLEASEAPF